MDKFGIKLTPSMVKVVNEAPVPTNYEELLAFLGLLMFYEKFSPDKVDHVKLLYDLSHDAKLTWTNECIKTILELKSRISLKLELAMYDPNLAAAIVFCFEKFYHYV